MKSKNQEINPLIFKTSLPRDRLPKIYNKTAVSQRIIVSCVPPPKRGLIFGEGKLTPIVILITTIIHSIINDTADYFFVQRRDSII